jgi:hypothetical protein
MSSRWQTGNPFHAVKGTKARVIEHGIVGAHKRVTKSLRQWAPGRRLEFGEPIGRNIDRGAHASKIFVKLWRIVIRELRMMLNALRRSISNS